MASGKYIGHDGNTYVLCRRCNLPKTPGSKCYHCGCKWQIGREGTETHACLAPGTKKFTSVLGQARITLDYCDKHYPLVEAQAQKRIQAWDRR